MITALYLELMYNIGFARCVWCQSSWLLMGWCGGGRYHRWVLGVCVGLVGNYYVVCYFSRRKAKREGREERERKYVYKSLSDKLSTSCFLLHNNT